MSEAQTKVASSTPWHLWVIGGVSLLWNAVGALDYFMTQTRNAAYMSKFTPEQLEYFYGFPAWVVAFWAIGVWGALLGSVLLLLRKGVAEWVFLASLVGVIVTSIYNLVLSNGMEVMGGGAGALIFPAVIFLIALGLYLYARAMRKRGVLS